MQNMNDTSKLDKNILVLSQSVHIISMFTANFIGKNLPNFFVSLFHRLKTQKSKTVRAPKNIIKKIALYKMANRMCSSQLCKA